jgi:hypothetical protein
MGRAKNIQLKPISAADANRIVQRLHYSGKVVPNSQVHFGVFLDGACGGALQFGPSLRRDLTCQLVKGTRLRECLELNRLAFADWLPRNSESRALAVSMRILRKQYQHIKWVISFADACQCGDGTIYRAAGFLLTDIKRNVNIRINPRTGKPQTSIRAYHDKLTSEFSSWPRLEGFQLRYVYFLHPDERRNLTVPVLPYSRIAELGAGMYRGQKRAGPVEGPSRPGGERRGRSDPGAPTTDQDGV